MRLLGCALISLRDCGASALTVSRSVFTIGLALVRRAVTTLAASSYVGFVRAGASALLLFIALVTLFGGYLIKVYAWKTILGNEGVLNCALMTIGLIDGLSPRF